MTPRLTAEDRAYILRRYNEGTPLRAIGRELGRPDITVRRTLEAAGIDFGPPKTSNKRSSPETEALVLHLYDEGLPWAQINEQAGVTSRTLAKILERNGRDNDRHSLVDDERAKFITALYEAGHTTRAVGEMTGQGKSTVNAVVVRNGGEIRNPPGCERPDFFDHVDTPEKAYWLGFIGADGCIVTTHDYPEGSHLAVKLATRDHGHLEKLRETLEAAAPVHTGFQGAKRHGYSGLCVSSRRLLAALAALGVTPRKSATHEPWDGPADLMPHYWRGLFDGDGSLARKTGDLYTLFLAGSEAAVRAFTAWAHEICGTSATPYFKSGCWNVSISGRYQVPKLARALYEGAPVSLDRKQEIADAILANEQPYRKPGPPRMEFRSEEERAEHFRALHAAAQRRYMERERSAPET